jgi:flagellar assembly factor FliW
MQAQTLELTESSFKTRFGEVKFDEAKAIAFPNGILGMPNQRRFFVAAIPDKKFDKFQVLQSLDDTDVSFAVLPLTSIGNLIDEEDLGEVRQVLEMDEKDTLVMLIVSIQKTPSGARLSVNLRAPLFIDVNNKSAYQIVLANSKYPVQHYLG